MNVESGSVRLLSHPLRPSTPAYGGGEGLTVRPLTAIARGGTANTVELSFPNHLGTHVDLPAHFFDGASTLTDFPPDSWIFTCPALLDVQPSPDGLIHPEGLLGPVPRGADLLLLRTGHEGTRGTDEYWASGPGLSPALGTWLRDERSQVRAVGMDLISVTSRLNRDAGRAAHRAFLDPHGVGAPVLLIEDMALRDCPHHLRFVLVSPLMLGDGDGAPVTVWAFPSSP